jgi:aspartokinase/homoserine dehydrogenase 1
VGAGLPIAVPIINRSTYISACLQGTVGAGLPIISTLKSLLDTGDEVQRIEGVFRWVGG